jgi:phosphohistidine phosphatase
MPPKAKRKGKGTPVRASRAAPAAPGAASTSPATTRTLWLLRHAKTVTDPPPGGSDFDRVLAPRGRRDATALGKLFAGDGEGLGPALAGAPRPSVALVSPAARTRATAEVVLADMEAPPVCRFDEDLYGAEPDELLGFVRALPDEAAAAMAVGHNPTAHYLSQALVSPADADGLALATRQGFPTCALGVYVFPVARWAEVDLGSATLLTLLVPPFA